MNEAAYIAGYILDEWYKHQEQELSEEVFFVDEGTIQMALDAWESIQEDEASAKWDRAFLTEKEIDPVTIADITGRSERGGTPR